jgi:signal transduction histidine kinase
MSSDTGDASAGDDDVVMRRRVVRVALVAVSVALIVFAVPLAVMVRSSLLTEEQGELERVALAAAVRVGPQFVAGDPVELPAAEPDNTVGVYDLSGHLKSGRGPLLADTVTRQAVAGVVVDGQVGVDIIVAVPVSSAERVTGVVRASAPMSVVWGRTLLAWSLLAGLAGGALIVAIMVARRQAYRLTAPLERLSDASVRIAGGDLGARAEPSGIPEINRVARTHNTMVDRLTQMLERQSHFSADASHQLRTPLSGLLLELEAARAAPPADLQRVIADAAERIRDLAQTVDDLLELARQHPGQWLTATPHPLSEAIRGAEHRWHGTLAREGRRLVLDTDPTIRDWQVPAGLVTQIVDVLADNALRHGHGTVTLTARDAAGILAVDVTDEGTVRLDPADVFARGTSGGDGHGIGLALARTMAEAGGGRLTITSRAPTTFTLYLPPIGNG